MKCDPPRERQALPPTLVRQGVSEPGKRYFRTTVQALANVEARPQLAVARRWSVHVRVCCCLLRQSSHRLSKVTGLLDAAPYSAPHRSLMKS